MKKGGRSNEQNKVYNNNIRNTETFLAIVTSFSIIMNTKVSVANIRQNIRELKKQMQNLSKT
jgi:hypothetical protein